VSETALCNTISGITPKTCNKLTKLK
jgi:hypothetical protein